MASLLYEPPGVDPGSSLLAGDVGTAISAVDRDGLQTESGRCGVPGPGHSSASGRKEAMGPQKPEGPGRCP